MANLRLFLVIVTTALFTASCGSLPSVGKQRKANTKKEPGYSLASANATEAPDVAAIKSQNLPAGKCGMLLWAVRAGKPIVIFKAVQGEGAEMVIDGRSELLELVSQSGEARFGMTSDQEYTLVEGADSQVGIRKTFTNSQSKKLRS